MQFDINFQDNEESESEDTLRLPFRVNKLDSIGILYDKEKKSIKIFKNLTFQEEIKNYNEFQYIFLKIGREGCFQNVDVLKKKNFLFLNYK